MTPKQSDDKFSSLTDSQKALIEAYVDGRLASDAKQALEALLDEQLEARAYLRALSAFESAVGEASAALVSSRETDQALGGWAWEAGGMGGRGELQGGVLAEARGKNEREGGSEPAGASTSRDGGPEAGQGGFLFWPLGGSAKPVLKYALVAAWTLVTVLLVQSFQGEPTDERAVKHDQLHGTQPPDEGRDAGAASTGFGVAQVARSEGVVWADGQRVLKIGDRLSKELIALETGVLVIGFDTGPRLTLTGPARFEIDAPNGATLLSGLIRFEHDGLGDAFDLKTPKALLVDLGTSYAVRVADGHEEIHVMDGEVWRSPVGYAGENNLVMLSAGDARRFSGAGNEPGAEIALDANVFGVQSDQENEEDLPADPGKLLAAFTPSDVLTARVKPRIKRDALEGVWRGPWRLTQRPLETKVVAEISSQEQPKPEQDGAAKAKPREKMPKLMAGEPWGGRVWARRVLAEPIQTDIDQVLYGRMDFGVGETNTKKPNAIFAVLTRQGSPAIRLSAALQAKRKGYLVARTKGVKRDAVELPSNTEMTMLVKIQTRANGPDQLFMSVFEADQVPEHEPDRWQLVGPPAWADEPLDLLGFQIISEIGLRFDGLRLGTGWRVATPVSDLTE